MKLNATYTLTTGTIVDPAYLNPSFEILGDDSDSFTSSTKVKSSTNLATYNSPSTSHVATTEAGIIMDLGSLKTVSSVRIKGSVGIEYGTGSIVTTATNPIVTYIYGNNGITTSTASVKNFGIANKFVSGNTGIFTSVGDLEYIFVDNTYNCSNSSTLFPAPIPSNYPKFFDTNQTARYKIQYSITGNAYLDFQDNIITVPAGQSLDLTISLPSNIGQIRYIKLSCIGSTSNPIQRKFSYKTTSTINDAIYVYKTYQNRSIDVYTTDITTVYNGSLYSGAWEPGYIKDFGSFPNVIMDLGSVQTIDIIGVSLASFNGVAEILGSTDGSNYSIIPLSNYENLAGTTFPTIKSVYKLNDSISARYIKLVGYDSNSALGSGGLPNISIAYYSFGISSFWVGKRSACPYMTFSSGSSLSTTGGSIIDSFLTLSSFYADDGSIAPTITLINDLALTTSVSGGATSLSVGAIVDQSVTLTYQWQKKESTGTSFTDITNATSSTLNLNNLTNSADNGDQYRVIVSAPGATSITSNTTTLSVAAPTVSYSTSALINNTPAVLYNNQIEEGQTLVINITASKSPETFNSNSMTLYWRRGIDAGGTLNFGAIQPEDADFTSAIPGGVVTLSGTGTSPQTLSGQISLTPKADQITEGNENFAIVFYTDNTYVTEATRSVSFNIIDTSLGSQLSTPTPTPSSTFVPSPTPTSTPPSITKDNDGCFIIPIKEDLPPTPTRTQTLTPTASITNTPYPTQSHTPPQRPTSTPTTTATATITPTNGPTNTPRLSQTPTQTQTSTRTPTVTPTNTITPTNTGTSAATPTPTPTSTITQSFTPTATKTPGPTASQTQTPTTTVTASLSQTPTPTPPICEGPFVPPPNCAPCESAIVIGYNEFIDPRCGTFRIPIYDCIYIPGCSQA